MLRLFAVAFLGGLALTRADAAQAPSRNEPTLTSASVNSAVPSGQNGVGSALIAQVEILFDWAHFSAGEIDGLDGDNFRNAVRAVQELRRMAVNGKSWTAPATIRPAPAVKQPAAKVQDEKGLVSVSGMSASDYAACVSDLQSAKVVFEQVGDAKEEGCELSGAVRLVSVATPFGDVAIAGKPTMLCSFARQFSSWSREVAAPLTLAYTGQKLAEIGAGSAFSCRARYDKPGAIPSEHAKGDAIDIASFGLADNRRVPVRQPESGGPLAPDLVHALRTTACGYFTTVLGPGVDAAHAEHLHFDSGVHGATPNYRICE